VAHWPHSAGLHRQLTLRAFPVHDTVQRMPLSCGSLRPLSALECHSQAALAFVSQSVGAPLRAGARPCAIRGRHARVGAPSTCIRT
jgi:hypothetical protein